MEGVEEQYRWKEYFEELLNLRNDREVEAKRLESGGGGVVL